jgi:Skp family chaperone for outer membrane proteins
MGPEHLGGDAMNRALLIASIACAAAAGCARDVGYVDLNRAFNESAEGKAATAEMKAMAETRRKEKDAEAEAMKLGPIQQPIATDAEWKAVQQRRSGELTKPAEARLRRILPAIARERRLAAIAPLESVFYADPSLDVTGELLRRFEAGEGQEDKGAELAAAKAKVADLERQLGGATKGK